MQEAKEAAATAGAEARAAAATTKEAVFRASKAEKALADMTKDLAVCRSALDGVASRGEQQQQLRDAQAEVQRMHAEVQELKGLNISNGMQLAGLRRQIAEQKLQQDPAAGTPRQLDVANAARETAERQLAECKEMMAAVSESRPPSAPHPTSPTSVIETDELGRGARECSGRQPGTHAEEWGERMPTMAERSTNLFVRVRPLHRGPNSPYDPGIAELIRRFVSETKIAKQNVTPYCVF